MNGRKIIPLFLCFSLVFLLQPCAQLSKIDSLNQALKKYPSTSLDTHFITLHLKLAFELKDINPDSAITIFKPVITKAESMNWNFGLARSYHTMAVLFWQNADFPQALDYSTKALQVWEVMEKRQELPKEELLKHKCKTIGNVGNIFNQQGCWSKALEFYFQALAISERLKDKKAIGIWKGNIGTIYARQLNNEKALPFFKDALELKRELHDNKGVATNLGNLGNVYRQMRQLDLALHHFKEALQVSVENGDKMAQARHLSNIGNVYCFKNEFDLALEFYMKSKKIREELKDVYGLASTHGNIGSLYLSRYKWEQDRRELKPTGYSPKDEKASETLSSPPRLLSPSEIQSLLNEAERYIALSIKEHNQVGGMDGVRDFELSYSELDSLRGNFKGAYLHYRNHIAARDSLTNDHNQQEQVRIEMNYDFDKKVATSKAIQEKKDAVAAEEKEKQGVILIAVVVVLLLVVVFSFFLYRRFKVTQHQKQIIELQKGEVEKQRELADSRRLIAEEQKEVIATQKSIVEEKQKEILDSIHYASRIQRAMLTNEGYMARVLNRDFFVFYQAKDIVAGDFYWVLDYRDLLYVCVADCTGHGVPGAFMSLLNIGFLNENVLGKQLRMPHEILNEQRRQIMEALNPKKEEMPGMEQATESSVKDGMDCVLMAFDLKNQQVFYAGANNGVCLVRNGELHEYKGQKMPIGCSPRGDEPFMLHTIQLAAGDVVYTWTDGLPDQFGANGKKFMSKNVKSFLTQLSSLPLNEQKEQLRGKWMEHKGLVEQTDDILVMGIKI